MFTIQKSVFVVSALLLGAAAQADTTGSPFTVGFEKPFVLHGQTGISVDKVKQKLVDNAWKAAKTRSKTWNCSVTLSIEGRDIAKENATIGEHYFGSMDLSCKRPLGSFSTRFSRVLFLGIRQCVQSETVYDQDYCTLGVVALQNELDRAAKGGALIRSTTRKREFYSIDSADAEKAIVSQQLLPKGLNPATIVGAQLFEVSIGKKGTDFFVKSPNANSNFARGANIFLTPDATALANDQSRGVEVQKRADDLSSRLVAVQANRTNPLAQLDSMLPQFLNDFSDALKVSLGIISPVEFFEAENRLKAIEKQLIDLMHAYRPEITNRDQFRDRYANASDEYRNLGEYLSSGEQQGDSSTPVETPASQVAPAGSMTKIERFPGGLVRITNPGFQLEGKSYYVAWGQQSQDVCRAFGFASAAYTDQWTNGQTTDDYDKTTGFVVAVDSGPKLRLVPDTRYDYFVSLMFCMAQ